MSKCDYPDCENEALYYGYQQCYFVCAEHVAWGEAIEAGLIKEMEAGQEEYHLTLHEREETEVSKIQEMIDDLDGLALTALAIPSPLNMAVAVRLRKTTALLRAGQEMKLALIEAARVLRGHGLISLPDAITGTIDDWDAALGEDGG